MEENRFMSDAEWNALLKSTSEQKTTLVIGDDLIKYNSKSISQIITEELIEFVKKQCNKQIEEKFKDLGLDSDNIPPISFQNEYSKYGIAEGSNPSIISMCEYPEIFAKTNFGSIEFVVKNILDNLSTKQYDLTNVKKLLKINRFSLIISTSFTNLFKNEIQNYCKDNNKRFYYGEIINNTLKIESPESKGTTPWSGKDNELLYISLMGQEGKNNSLDNLVISEEDIISLVYSWVSAINLPSCATLKNELSNRYLLALGCHIPSWAFRFIWFLIKNPLGISSQNQSICTRPLPYNENVKKFILRNFSKIIESNKSFDFVDEFSSRWKESNYEKSTTIFENDIIPDSTDVFISYASEDRDLVMTTIIPIIQTLKNNNNITYWFDKNDIRIGDEWEADIIHAVTHSKVFLVVQTPNTKRISKDVKIRYLRKEWMTAIKHQKECNDILAIEGSLHHFHYILPVITTTEDECMANSMLPFQSICMNENFENLLREQVLRLINENKDYDRKY